jgi:hypothetical protein
MAKKAQDAGAQIVVVPCYRDNEYDQRPNAQQLTVAPQLLADGNIDLVLGHTADVVQPLQKINGKGVAHGLGNLAAAHRQPATLKSERDPALTGKPFEACGFRGLGSGHVFDLLRDGSPCPPPGTARGDGIPSIAVGRNGSSPPPGSARVSWCSTSAPVRAR